MACVSLMTLVETYFENELNIFKLTFYMQFSISQSISNPFFTPIDNLSSFLDLRSK